MLTVVCSLGITWWRQWRLSEELANAKAELELSKQQVECYQHVADITRTLDLSNPQHQTVFKSLQYFGSFPFCSIERVQLDPVAKLEIVVINDEFISIPGSDTTLCVLLLDGKLIDSIVRESSTREEIHRGYLEDVDDDGDLELVVYSAPGMLRNKNIHDHVYEMSKDGFRKVN